MNATHTPGPWTTYRTHSNSRGTSIGTIAGVIARLNTDGPFTADEQTANARLIAAAPALYAALEGLLDFAETYGPSERASETDWSGFFDECRAALAAARGE